MVALASVTVLLALLLAVSAGERGFSEDACERVQATLRQHLGAAPLPSPPSPSRAGPLSSGDFRVGGPLCMHVWGAFPSYTLELSCVARKGCA